MEKHVPHYPLAKIKAALEAGQWRFTQSARTGALALGFYEAQALEVIRLLDKKDFYKSMTTHADHKIWQDVYRPNTLKGRAYIKLTIHNGLLIVSFKEL